MKPVHVTAWLAHPPPAGGSRGDSADGLAVGSSDLGSCRWVFHSCRTLLLPATMLASHAAAPIHPSLTNPKVSSPRLLKEVGFSVTFEQQGNYKSNGGARQSHAGPGKCKSRHRAPSKATHKRSKKTANLQKNCQRNTPLHQPACTSPWTVCTAVCDSGLKYC